MHWALINNKFQCWMLKKCVCLHADKIWEEKSMFVTMLSRSDQIMYIGKFTVDVNTCLDSMYLSKHLTRKLFLISSTSTASNHIMVVYVC